MARLVIIWLFIALLQPHCYAQQPVSSTRTLYNFKPGDSVVFYDNFSGYKEGSFPSRWQILKATDKWEPTRASETMLDSVPVLYFRTGNGMLAKPLWDVDLFNKNKDNYWTVEFDFLFVTEAGNTYNHIGIIMPGYPDLWATCGVRSGSDTCNMKFEDNNGPILSANYPVSFNKAAWHHFAVSITKQNASCYIDHYRLINAANPGCDLTSVALFGRARVAIRNFRIARTDPAHPKKELPAAKDASPINKLLTEKKFVTQAITFDKNSTRIKPESAPFMHELADFLFKNPDIKLEIDGHTDNDGSANGNRILSENRAKAIKKMLVSFGVAESRLLTKGFGAIKPIDTNSTPEGKALNRRVEFIRL